MADSSNEPTVYQVYKRRFFIYAVLTVQIALPIFGFVQFTANANFISQYYGVGFEAINFTALICSICNLLLFYPVGKCVDKYGLRLSITWCAALNAIAAALKAIAFPRSLFWLIYVAQCFHAIPVLMSMAVVPLVASNWFPPHEVAFVMGFCIACTTLGTLIPFIFPSTVFADGLTIDDIGNGLYGIYITFAIISFVAFLATIIIVREKPPTPPCASSVFYEQTNVQNQSMWFMVTNRNVFLLLVYHTLEFSLFQAIIITLNQSITTAFPNSSSIVTIAGILLNASGIPGSMIIGGIIRKYPKYKLTLMLLNILLFLALLVYMLGLYIHNVVALYIATVGVSFANLGIQSFSMDFLLEVSYPNPGGILFSVVTAVGSLPTIIFAPLVTLLINNYGPSPANFVAVAVAFLAILSTIFVKDDLRRRQANQEIAPLLDNGVPNNVTPNL